MPVPTPSLAGVIPQESVLDGLAKLFQLVGPDAKNRRAQQQANVAATQAGTRNTDVTTDYLPKYYGLHDRQTGVSERQQSEVERENQYRDPLAERQVGNAEKQTSNEYDIGSRNAGTNEARQKSTDLQWAQQFPLYQQEQTRRNEETTASIQQGQDASQRGWEELRQKSKLTDANIEELKRSNPAAHSVLHDLLTGSQMGGLAKDSAGNYADPEQAAKVNGLIEAVLEQSGMHEAAANIRKARQQQEATKQKAATDIESRRTSAAPPPLFEGERYNMQDKGNATPAYKEYLKKYPKQSQSNPFASPGLPYN